MGALDAEVVAAPGEFEIGVAAVPGVWAGEDFFGVVGEAADECIAEEAFGVEGGVVQDADADADACGEKDVGGDAVDVPRVPAGGEALLHGLVLGRTREVCSGRECCYEK